MYENRVIDVLEFLRRLLLKWRLILIYMIIGGLALNVVGILKSYKYIKYMSTQPATVTEVSGEEKLLKLKEKLTERETAEVNMLVESYKIYRKEYLNELFYNKNSVYMNLNYACVPSQIVDFYIDNDYEVVYPVMAAHDTTMDIITSLSRELLENDLFAEVSEELEVESRFLQELVTINYSDDSEDLESSILSIQVLGKDRAFCEKLMNVLTEKVNTVLPKLQSIYGEFEVKEVSNMYREGMHIEVHNAQQERISKINTIKVSMNNLVTSLKEDQKAYYYEALDQMFMTEPSEAEEVLSDVVVETTTPARKIDYINVKYIIVGAVIGAFLVFMYVFIGYVFSFKLQMPEDMSSVFKVAVFGIINKDKKPKWCHKIDDIINAMFNKRGLLYSKEMQFRMTCEAILSVANHKELKTVCLTGSVIDDEYIKCISEMEAALDGKIDLICTRDTIFDEFDTIKALQSSDAVVLIEQLGKSQYIKIEELTEKCKMHEIPMIGSVVLM